MRSEKNPSTLATWQKGALRLALPALVLIAFVWVTVATGTARADDAPSLIILDSGAPKTVLGQPASLGRGNSKLLLDTQQWLDIPLDRSVTVRVKKLRVSQQSGATVWVGEVQPSASGRRYISPGTDLSHDLAIDPKNLAILVAHDERVTGTVIVDGVSYEILPMENGQVAVSRRQDADLPDPPTCRHPERTRCAGSCAQRRHGAAADTCPDGL